MSRSFVTGLCFAGCLALSACTARDPVIDTDAETYDGMVPVRDSGMLNAWVKPDIDIGSYRRVMLAPVEVRFRATRPGAGTTLTTSRTREFPVSPADRQRLANIVTEVFREELARSRNLQLTDEAGPDVLIVEASLLDVVSKVPPEPPARSEIFLDEVGEATLVMELKDAVSGETLARAVDRRAADPVDSIDGPVGLSRTNAVTAWQEVRRVARRWAARVTERIDQLYVRSRIPG